VDSKPRAGDGTLQFDVPDLGRIKLRLELGEAWSIERIERLLEQAQRHSDPQRRFWFLAQTFLAEKTPFLDESKLPEMPEGTMRVRFETFDCITLVHSLYALNNARSFAGLARNLWRIRYSGPPGPATMIHYAWNCLHRIEELGMARNVTAELLPAGDLGSRTVKLGVKADGQPYLSGGNDGRGDWSFGQEVTALYVPTERVPQIESQLDHCDTVLLVSTKDPGEYPGIVRHALFVYRKPDDPTAYILHSGMSRVGAKDGPRAGVSLLTFWDDETGALRDDGVLRPMQRYIERQEVPTAGIVVFRPLDGLRAQ